MRRIFGSLILALALVACDSKPSRYLVICDAMDENKWTLIDVVKKDGYIISCTYQSPDRKSYYKHICDSGGCRIVK